MKKIQHRKNKNIIFCRRPLCERKIDSLSREDFLFPSNEPSISAMVDFHTETTPDKVAIYDSRHNYTYQHIASKSKSLASLLYAQGVQADRPIAILLNNKAKAIISMLAVLRTGVPYVVIDTTYPKERIEYMLENSNAQYCITSRTLVDQFHTKTNLKTLVYDDLSETYAIAYDPIKKQHGDIAYLIYTSGSTGDPKGIRIRHSSVINLVRNQNYVSLTKEDNIAQVCNMSFDLSAFEIWGALINGSSLHLISKDTLLDPKELENALISREISTLLLPTGLFHGLAHESPKMFASVKNLLVAGEALNPKLANKVLSNSNPSNFVNAYGPAEVTTFSTYHKITSIDEDVSIPIGRPINGLKARIMSKEGTVITKPYTPGELYISGIGVADGYHNNENLTRDKFERVKKLHETVSLQYKTGDIVQWKADGALDFIGRQDNQVKIRGYRVELSEIENAFQAIENVAIAIAVAIKNNRGQNNLSVHYSTNNSDPLNKDQIVEALKKRLPEYMIPSVIVHHKKMPLTPNGKVDKEKLRAPIKEKSPDQANIRKELLGIWSEVLGISNITEKDNFFELGGDSILSLQVISKASKKNIKLKPSEFFRNPTVESLSQVAEELSSLNKASAPTETIVSSEKHVLTPIQYWFFEDNLKNKNYFHHFYHQVIEAHICPEILKKSLIKLVDRHQILNTKFKRDNKQWHQYFSKRNPKAWLLQYHDIKELNATEQAHILSIHKEELCDSIDIQSGQLIKCSLHELDPSKFILSIAIHHLVIDGVSWRVLLEDLESIYRAESFEGKEVLPKPTSSYTDWINAVYKYSKSTALLEETTFWQDTLNKIPETPTDYKLGPNNERSVSVCIRDLDTESTDKLLKQVHSKLKTQINEILLSALIMTHYTETGEMSMGIDLEGHGREADIGTNIELSRSIGWFTSIFPVFLDATEYAKTKNLSYLINSVKNSLRRIPRKGIGFGILKYISKKLKLPKNTAQVNFNYLGQFDQQSREGALFSFSGEPFSSPSDPSNLRKHLIYVESWITNKRLQVKIAYSVNYHRKRTINNFLDTYIENLKEIIDYCSNCKADENLKKDQEIHKDNILKNARQSLTPLQKGMLYHAVSEPRSTAYTIQFSWKLKGILDIDLYTKAWNILIQENDELRARFIWAENSPPYKEIEKVSAMPCLVKDISSLSETDQATYIESFMDQNKNTSITLSEAPLMRVHIFKLGENNTHIIWTHHHIILDGWSSAEVVNRVHKTYDDLLQHNPSTERYNIWLKQLPTTESKEFWMQYLEGSEPTVVTDDLNWESAKKDFSTKTIVLPENLSSSINYFCKKHHITLNTFFQGIWTSCLKSITKSDEVIFGTTVSMRLPSLEKTDNILGLLINPIPVRINYKEPLPSIHDFHKIQQGMSEIVEHAHISLPEIRYLSDNHTSNSLFDTMLIFESYEMPDIQSEHFSVTDLSVSETTHYPLTTYIIPGKTIVIKFFYNNNLLSHSDICEIQSDFTQKIKHYISQ